MFFSPSGDEIGFVSNRRLWRLPLTGSEPHLIATVPDGFVGGGSWSDDGEITLAVSGQMLHVPATGGTLVPFFAADTTGMQFGGPQRWSRERVLLYTTSSRGLARAVEAAVAAFARLGADIVEVQVPDRSEVLPTWPVLCALPCGVSASGIPYTMQLAGRPLSEATLCRIGQAYESVTRWHTLHPPV